jgi:hypothetical protein
MEKYFMRRCILFPFRIEDDNRKGFAFAIELARRLNADMLALTSLQLGEHHTRKRKKFERLVACKKNQVFCKLLEMKGYYHGRYNQWNAFDEIMIHSRIVKYDLIGAICVAINKHTDPVIVLQHNLFSGTGLYEEISSRNLKGHASFFVLPRHSSFDVASPILNSVLFCRHKRLAFINMLKETKIFDLPRDRDEFRKEMIIRQAV